MHFLISINNLDAHVAGYRFARIIGSTAAKCHSNAVFPSYISHFSSRLFYIFPVVYFTFSLSYILHSRLEINPVTNPAPAHKAQQQRVFSPNNLSQESFSCGSLATVFSSEQ